MDVTLLVLRIAVGGMLVGHGTQKLFGWFGGHGIHETARFMHQLGYRPPRFAAVMAGFTETIGGGLLLLGLFTPLSSAMVIGAMLNAIVSAHLRNGPWASNGGYELPLIYLVAAVAIVGAGPGELSLDAVLGVSVWGGLPALLATALGVVAGAIALSGRQVRRAAAASSARDRQETLQPQRRDRLAA